MEVWVKYEPVEVKCLICLKDDLQYGIDCGREQNIYEILINQKVESERIRVAFCPTCSQKLLDIDDFRNLCQTSLISYEKLIDKDVKYERPLLSPGADVTFDDDDDDDYKNDYKEDVLETAKPSKTYCSVCKKHVETFLGKHIKKVHMTAFSDGRMSCNLCTASFKGLPEARRHFQGNHLEFEKPKKCEECGESFKSVREYSRHKKLEKYSGKMECHHCGRKCSTRESIKAHIQVKHMGAKFCRFCNKTFFDRQLYAEHITMEEEKQKLKQPKTFLCNICGAVFKNHKQMLTNHHARVHANAYNYSCEICGKAFISNGLRNQHVKSSHGQENLCCDTCGQHFGSKVKLNQHKRRVHQAREPCDICGKLTNPILMKDHKKRHTEERPFNCPCCSETFKCRTSLRKHLFSHSKTRPFNCLQCETGYYMISYLKSHYQRQHGIVYTNKETLKNCRKEKPQIPEDIKF